MGLTGFGGSPALIRRDLVIPATSRKPRHHRAPHGLSRIIYIMGNYVMARGCRITLCIQTRFWNCRQSPGERPKPGHPRPRLAINADFHAVIARLHGLRQRLAKRLIIHVDMQVRKNRSSGPQRLNPFKG